VDDDDDDDDSEVDEFIEDQMTPNCHGVGKF